MGSPRNIFVFIIPLIVSICSLIIILLSIRFRWMGYNTRPTIDYCEVSNGTFIKEPANTWSNLGFIIVGLIIAWQMMWGSFTENINFLTRNDFISILFSSLVICIGPASMAWHASYTTVAYELDSTAMYLICAFLIAYSMRRLFDWGIRYFIEIFVLVILVSELVGLSAIHIPILVSADNLIFAVFLTVFSVSEILFIVIRRPYIKIGWGIASLITFLIAFLLWNLSRDNGLMCNPRSWFQGHAVWHLLDALALYFLFRYYVSEHNTDQSYLL